jgi:ankyrin repeat protein
MKSAVPERPRAPGAAVKVSLTVSLLAVFLLLSCAGLPAGRSTALHDAASLGDAEMAKELVSSGIDVDARDEEGRTALHRAVLAGNVPITAVLLNAGSNPDIQDTAGRVPLHYTVVICHTDLAAMLLGAGADPLIPDRSGETPLDFAKRSGCEDVVHTIESSL